MFALAPQLGLAADPLDEKETAALQAGKLVRRVRDLKQEAWPEVTVYAVLPGPPEKHVETYVDFPLHTLFVPGLLKSELITAPDGTEVLLTEMKMPWPLSNAVCTTRVTRVRTGDAVEVNYALVTGNHMKDMYGSARFAPWPGGGTLFRYTTHTTPRSPIAGLWRGRVPEDVMAAVKATAAFLSSRATAPLSAQAQ